MDKHHDTRQSSEAIVISTTGQTVTQLAAPYARATDAAVEGMEVLVEEMSRLSAVSEEIKKGFAFEVIEPTKFNVAAAVRRSPLRARPTAAEGLPHAPADVIIRNGDEIVREAQLKALSRPVQTTHSLSRPSYTGMEKVVLKGQEGRVRELASARARTGTLKAAEYADTATNVTGELHAGGVTSGGTTLDEAVTATRDPKGYAGGFEGLQVRNEVVQSAIYGAGIGAAVGGGISLIRNAAAVIDGKKGVEDAVADTAQDCISTAVQSGIVGAGTAVIRYGAVKAGMPVLARSNVAAGVAFGALGVGKTLLEYSNGEITADEVAERFVRTGATTTAAVAGATIGQALISIPLVGAIIGGLVGALFADSLFD